MFPALTCCGCRSQRQVTTYIKHHKDCKCCSVAFFIFIVQPGFDVLECQKCQHDMLCCKIDIVLRKCLCERRAKQRRHVCALLERELRVQPAMRIQLLASLAVLSNATQLAGYFTPEFALHPRQVQNSGEVYN